MTQPLISWRAETSRPSYVQGYALAEAFVIGLDRRYCRTHEAIRCWFDDYSLIPPGSVVDRRPGSRMLVVRHHPYLPMRNLGVYAQTLGRYVYLREGEKLTGPREAHEYIHLLQQEGGGAAFNVDYLVRLGVAHLDRYVWLTRDQVVTYGGR